MKGKMEEKSGLEGWFIGQRIDKVGSHQVESIEGNLCAPKLPTSIEANNREFLTLFSGFARSLRNNVSLSNCDIVYTLPPLDTCFNSMASVIPRT